MSKGLSGVTELLLIGIVIGALLTIWGVTSCSGGSDSPRHDANHDCEVAWVREYDGDDDTKNETAILDQQWCQDHLAMQEQEVQQEQIEQVAP